MSFLGKNVYRAMIEEEYLPGIHIKLLLDSEN